MMAIEQEGRVTIELPPGVTPAKEAVVMNEPSDCSKYDFAAWKR
jgi:hypothetical protein